MLKKYYGEVSATLAWDYNVEAENIKEAEELMLGLYEQELDLLDSGYNLKSTLMISSSANDLNEEADND